MLYKNLPKTVGLRRLTLHKSRTLNSAEVTYLLLVECTHFMDHIGEAANLLPILRDDRSHFAACTASNRDYIFRISKHIMLQCSWGK